MIYVGIDVAKNKHDCFITNSNGEVLFKPFTIANSMDGFNELLKKIKSITSNFDEIKVGLEATGHYSYNILGFLLNNNLLTFVINPLHTNLYRKSISLRKTKTDKEDAMTIAHMLMSNLDLKPYSLTSYHNEELKSLTRYRFDKVRDRAKLKTSIKRLINILFPELESLVKTVHMKSIYDMLYEFPSANNKENAEKWREHFATLCNQYLEKAGEQKRVDHRSYKRQGKEEIPTIHLGASASALERKGVETEKGNINREIKKHNFIVRAVRERIAELTSWLNDFTKVLFEKYEKYKQEKKEEYENKAELFNLYEYISIYYDLQGEKARKLNLYASNKKIGADLNRFSKARIYLSDNRLQTIADLQGKITELQGKNKHIYQDIKAKTQRIETLHQCLVYADIIKENKQVFEEWKSKTFLFKDSFYNAHQEEIDKYQRAKGRIEKLSGESALKPKSWKKEIESLEQEIKNLNRQSQRIKAEYEQINHIKYAVKTVKSK